jgi:putative tryptophan/tyrosine transport system substrate-binding protein
MKRRQFIAGLGSAAVWPAVVRAQRAMPVIGVLYGVSAAEWAEYMLGFRRGLGEIGFVEGRNVAIEYRWAEGKYDRLPAMAADLVARRVAVILAGGANVAVRAAMAATQTIPIVFTTIADPVADGLVASLNRPGGNVTGITGISVEVLSKLFEILREAIPAAGKFALLVNPNNPVTARDAIEVAQTAVRRLGVELVTLYAGDEREIDQAFEAAVQQRAGVVVLNDAYFNSRREQVAALSFRHALPVTGATREAVAAGLLISYSASVPDTYRQAGIYVGRILRGEKPADLPVMQPTKFGLVVNVKTAKVIQ